jgi:hypothetical protein
MRWSSRPGRPSSHRDEVGWGTADCLDDDTPFIGLQLSPSYYPDGQQVSVLEVNHPKLRSLPIDLLPIELTLS